MSYPTQVSHHYQGSWFDPYDLSTPEEIKEAGFVFVAFPTFLHQYADPYNPIMKSYAGGDDKTCRPVAVRTTSLIGDLKIKGLHDYFSKKAEFKPRIIEQMKRNRFHYVYKVLLCSSPVILSTTEFFYPIFARGYKLPPNL